MRIAAALLAPLTAAGLLLSGCTARKPPEAAQPRYVVGSGYQLGGTWFYPKEELRYDATGLASVLPDEGGLTADGERRDATAMVAAHQTLQLPTVARVTNLETGAQVLVRINDRGPASPARMLALSPRAASLLGMAGVGRVRVQVDEAMSTALREQLGGGPRVAVAAAPRTGVQSESLAPPPGVGQSSRGRTAGVAVQASAAAEERAEAVPDRLPETVTQVPARPGLLMLHAGSFSQGQYAQRLAARIAAGRVERVSEGRGSRFDVVAGPYASVAEADAALDRARRAGVSDARIAVD